MAAASTRSCTSCSRRHQGHRPRRGGRRSHRRDHGRLHPLGRAGRRRHPGDHRHRTHRRSPARPVRPQRHPDGPPPALHRRRPTASGADMSTRPRTGTPTRPRATSYRYYDGTAWTDHVSDRASPAGIPWTAAGQARGSTASTRMIRSATRPTRRRCSASSTEHRHRGGGSRRPRRGRRRDLRRADPGRQPEGQAHRAQQPVQVFDQHGNQLGIVHQVGQSRRRRCSASSTSVDQYLTHQLQITRPTAAVCCS